jgi:hypothetical protein
MSGSHESESKQVGESDCSLLSNSPDKDEEEEARVVAIVTADQVEKHLGELNLCDRQRTAAKDVALSLNSWLQPLSKNDGHDQTWLWESRSAQVEAERLAAAAEATEYFRACKDKRLYEHTLGGLVNREDIVDARCKPWTISMSTTLQQTGLSAEQAEKAVRLYEPYRISEDVEERYGKHVLHVLVLLCTFLEMAEPPLITGSYRRYKCVKCVRLQLCTCARACACVWRA